MRTAVHFGLMVLCLRAAIAQLPPNAVPAKPDVAEILEKVIETYKNVSQYEIESTVSLRNQKTGQFELGVSRIAFKSPDKYRVQMEGAPLNQDRDPSDPVVDEGIAVYDGANLRAYNPKSNEYRVYVAPHLPRDSSPEAVDLYMGIGMYRRPDGFPFLARAQFLREDRATTESGSVDCFVIGDRESALWIDKRTYHVLRMDGDGVSQVFKVIKLDEPVSDDLFKFVPPLGSKKLN